MSEAEERSLYDGFDHALESSKLDSGSLKSTTYAFDPLDRTASKTADGKTTDFTCLGLSSEALDEEVAGALTASCQYSPWGERLFPVKHNTDGPSEDAYYGCHSHSDVETPTTKDGDTKATCGYTAYGSDGKSDFTGSDKPDAAAPTKEAHNPYRFNAKRWDAKSGTYDMGLSADPFTGNRYAFTGGNPTSRVEADMGVGSWPERCLVRALANQASILMVSPSTRRVSRTVGARPLRWRKSSRSWTVCSKARQAWRAGLGGLVSGEGRPLAVISGC